MEKLTVDEYLDLDSSKKDYLISVIGNEECRMIGQVDRIEATFCIVNNIRVIRSEEGHRLFKPFRDGSVITEVFASSPISKELMKKNIVKGKIVFFSLAPNSKFYEDQGRYFTIKDNSVDEAKDLEEFFKSIELEKMYARIFTDFSKDDEENRIYFAQDLKKAHDIILNSIEDKKLEIINIDNNIINARKDLSELKEYYELELKTIEDKLVENHRIMKQEFDDMYEKEKELKINEIKEIENKLAELKKYNILSNREGVNTLKTEDKLYKEDIEERIRHIQGYLMLNNKKNLDYDINTIKNLYAGLRTDQIIVLSGKPGSGKTSLVEGFAEAIGAELSLIPVQPNWMDKSDLLGFYNPIQKSYVSTPFLDVLLKSSIKAKNNCDEIFFICLDEMNLSHVEYYFAEFLSKLQTDRKIQLYSQNIFEDIKEELIDRNYKFKADIKNLTIENFLTNGSGESIDNYLKFKQQYKMMDKYPFEIEIPRNLKFLGTINKDESTKDLSPKVIDRCFIINLENQTDSKKIKELKTLKGKFTKEKEVYTKKLDLRYSNIENTTIDVGDKINNKIQRIMEKLNDFHISLSHRFKISIMQILSGESFKNTDEVFDIAIASLIFPKVNHTSDDINLNDLINVLEEISSGKRISTSILQWMKIYDDDKLTYWR